MNADEVYTAESGVTVQSRTGQMLDYLSFDDRARELATARVLCVLETATRWVALVAILAMQPQWTSLSNQQSLILFFIAFLAVPIWMCVLLAAAVNSRRAAAAYRWPRRLIAVGVCVVLGGSALLTGWPFYLAFVVSKPFLNRLADQASAGKNVSGWHWAGVWIITDVCVEADGSVGMYFDNHGSGWTGIVRYASPTSTPVGSNNGRTRLGGNWELVDED